MAASARIVQQLPWPVQMRGASLSLLPFSMHRFTQSPSVRIYVKLALRLAIYALIIFGFLALFQDRLLYYPDKVPLATALADARREGLTAWPSEGDYRGLLVEPIASACGTLVLFHGNAGHAGHRDWYANVLTRFGFRVILAEYPAYGPRAGQLGEAALVSDAAETIALARQQFQGPLFLAGESLGAGVAAAALIQSPTDIKGLLLITPWDKLENIGRHHYPWVPVKWLLRDRYDTVGNLNGFRGRIAVVLAEQDSIVPAQFGRDLFDSLSGLKSLWTIPGADHNEWMNSVDDAWWRSVISFLAENQCRNR